MTHGGKPINCPTCGQALEDATVNDLTLGWKYELPRTGEEVVVKDYTDTDPRFVFELARLDQAALPYLVDHAGQVFHQAMVETQVERWDPANPDGTVPGGSFELVIAPTAWKVGDMVRLGP